MIDVSFFQLRILTKVCIKNSPTIRFIYKMEI